VQGTLHLAASQVEKSCRELSVDSNAATRTQNLKIEPGGSEKRPGTQGKGSNTAKTHTNSGTLCRPEGNLYQNPHRERQTKIFDEIRASRVPPGAPRGRGKGPGAERVGPPGLPQLPGGEGTGMVPTQKILQGCFCRQTHGHKRPGLNRAPTQNYHSTTLTRLPPRYPPCPHFLSTETPPQEYRPSK
jgi:hypothetical protein